MKFKYKNFEQLSEHLKEIEDKLIKDYDDKLGTPRQAIEWYKPRLTEMRRVLKNTGSIYLQCDYRLVHYLFHSCYIYLLFYLISHLNLSR